MPLALQPTRLDGAALADVYQRLRLITTSAWRRVFSLCIFAELCYEAAHPSEGLQALASIEENMRDAAFAPEIRRLEGESLVQQSASNAEAAERRFRIALDIARRRSEKSLELRAAISLARLLAARGRGDEARRELADVYAWFTEGFDTRDLRIAASLLTELAA